jgi:ubiquinone biosynthesis protein UbiJ
MATRSPFPFLDDVLNKLAQGLQPPEWVVAEAQHRLVLLLNHVLMQEPEAQARLTRQAGRTVEARWRSFVVRFVATPAGLLDLAPLAGAPDLTLTLTEDSPWSLTQTALRGDKPAVRIAGDVQLAAEINWLVDNVRWDLEEDLSRLIGDAPAHAVGNAARRMAQALRSFIAPRAGARGAAAAAPPAGAAAPAPGPVPVPPTGGAPGGGA